MLLSGSSTINSKFVSGTEFWVWISNSNSDPREKIKALNLKFKNPSLLILSGEMISCATVDCLYNSLNIIWIEKIIRLSIIQIILMILIL